ncbi:hypothetical protein [Acinetobacter variabilis]|uniref:hypothetical protein n=1 Tax=Acinetobacter variabilis TaxID=70346 RepID=UPI00289FF4BF|nr:hypothetical protein [Acinetobacter variabilis]
MTNVHDQFAMAAMPALIMMGRTEEKVAELAYKQADAMVAEREKGSSESVHSIKLDLIKRIQEERGIDVSKSPLTVKHLLRILIDGELPF